MQTSNRLLHDISKMLSGAISVADGVKDEAEVRVRSQLEAMVLRLELVRREEFEVVREMAVRAREENQRLEERISELEKKAAARKKPRARKPRTTDS